MSTKTTITRTEGEDVLAVLALLGCALIAFRDAYGGSEFMVVGLIGALLGVAIALLTARWRAPALLVAAVTIIVYFVLGSAVAVRDRAIALVLPSGDSLVALVVGPIRGWVRLLTTLPPAGRTGGLLVIPFVCGLLAAVVAGSIALRTRSAAWPAVPIAAVLVLAILVGLHRPVSVVASGAGLAAGGLAWIARRYQRRRVVVVAGHRRRRVASAVVMLALVSAAGLVVGSHLPFVNRSTRITLRDRIDPPFDPRVYGSPLNAFRSFAVSRADDVLFTVAGLPAGARIRLATMDTYDGLVWGMPGGNKATADSAGYFQRTGSQIPVTRSGPHADVRIVNRSLSSVWLPDVGEVTGISFTGARAKTLGEAFRYDRGTDSAAVATGLQPGDSWDMQAVLPPSANDQLVGRGKATIAQVELDNVPGQLRALGADVVGDETDAYKRATLLADYLRSNGWFSDGKKEQAASSAGHGAKRLAEFVAKDRPIVGNGEQYAATLAIMTRELGLPSRVVMGFAPKGDATGAPIDVKGSDVSAWVEVAFSGAGWIAFDPTPPKDKTVIDQKPQPKPNPKRQTQVPPPPPVVQPDAQTPKFDQTLNDQDRKEQKKKQNALVHKATGLPVVALVGAGVVGVPLAVALLAAAAIVMLKARRRGRRRRLGKPTERIANGWREVVDSARDLGRPIPPSVTRRESAAFVDDGLSLPLARSADAAVFGPNDPDDEAVRTYWDHIDTHVRSMMAERGVWERVRAKVSVTSLRGLD